MQIPAFSIDQIQLLKPAVVQQTSAGATKQSNPQQELMALVSSVSQPQNPQLELLKSVSPTQLVQQQKAQLDLKEEQFYDQLYKNRRGSLQEISQIQKLQGLIATQKTHIDQLTSKLASKEIEVSQLKATNQQLVDQVLSTDTRAESEEIQRLNMQVDDLQRVIKSLAQSLNSQKEQPQTDVNVENLQRENEQLKSTLQTKESEFQTLQHSMTQEAEALKQQIITQSTELTSMKDQIKAQAELLMATKKAQAPCSPSRTQTETGSASEYQFLLEKYREIKRTVAELSRENSMLKDKLLDKPITPQRCRPEILRNTEDIEKIAELQKALELAQAQNRQLEQEAMRAKLEATMQMPRMDPTKEKVLEILARITLDVDAARNVIAHQRK